MTRISIVVRAVLTVALGAAPVSAQRDTRADSAAADSARTRLNPVTVVGSRSPINVLLVPLAVTVVGKDKLERTRGYGLDEAMRFVPGVLAQSRYGNQDVRIVIRGFGARGAGDRSNAGTSRGIRVLMDGFPETEPDGRTSFDGIDLASAERIDVVRSNASSLWGNAAGGVVSVSTVPTWERSRASIGQEGGSFGLRRTSIGGGTMLGGARAYGSFVNSTFDGWRQGSDSRRALVNLGIAATLGERTDLGVFAYGTNNLFHIPGPLTRAEAEANPELANATYLSRQERRFNRVGRLGVTLAHRPDDRNEFTGMVYVNPKYLQRSERGTFRDFTRYHAGGNLTYRNSVRLSESVGSQLMIGADEAYQDGAILFYSLAADGERGTELRDNKREGANNVGVFLQEELSLGPSLTLSLGARYDNVHYIARSFITPSLNDQKNFSRVTPKLGATWRLGQTRTLYANIGGGIEAPAGNETDPAATFGQDTIYGINPLLKPIRSTTYEVGTKHIVGLGAGFLRELSYDVAVYQTEVKNEIVPYRGGRFYFTAGAARRRGLEMALSTRSGNGLSLETALTLADNKYQEYQVDSVHYSPALAGHFADFSGNKVVGLPDVFGSASLGFAPASLKGVAFRVGMQGVGKYFADDANSVAVPGYALLDASISFDRPLMLGREIGLRGFVGINNAGDRHYMGSAFLNPDVVNGVPVAFEPGLPRNVVVSFSLARER